MDDQDTLFTSPAKREPAVGLGISSSVVVITSGPPYLVTTTRLYRIVSGHWSALGLDA